MADRLTYQNWIVDLGRDPGKSVSFTGVDDVCPRAVSLHELAAGQAVAQGDEDSPTREAIRQAVRTALERLSSDEREIVERFHFIGQTYRRISEGSGRSIHKLEAIHKRALRKLKKELSGFAREMFGIVLSDSPPCPLCRSPERTKIDMLIRNRPRESTWREIIRELKEHYGIIIRTPQTLIGHEKYH